MATLPAATGVGTAGLDITTPATAAAATQTFANSGGRRALVVKNGNAGTVVATITTRKTVLDGNGSALTLSNRTVSIAAGKYFIISVGPSSADLFNDANGEVTVAFDVYASVLLQVIDLN